MNWLRFRLPGFLVSLFNKSNGTAICWSGLGIANFEVRVQIPTMGQGFHFCEHRQRHLFKIVRLSNRSAKDDKHFAKFAERYQSI
jgi:hypothetical protein